MSSGLTRGPLRAGFAGGLRPVLTRAARDGAGEDGRDGLSREADQPALNRTEKHRHDGPDGNLVDKIWRLVPAGP